LAITRVVGRSARRNRTTVDPDGGVLVDAILGENGVPLDAGAVRSQSKHGVLVVNVTTIEVTVSATIEARVSVVIVASGGGIERDKPALI
jgi:hypothetical protein